MSEATLNTVPARRGSAPRKPRAARSASPPTSAPAEVCLRESDPGNPLKRIGGSESPRFNSVLLRQVLSTIRVPTDGPEDRFSAAAVAVAAFRPQDEIEAMFAAQAVALHFGAMEALRRSMVLEQPGDLATRLRRDGANLARAMGEVVEALDRRRGKGPQQVVRVERVVVQEGGQAIVGPVSAAGTQTTRGEGGGG